MGKPGFVNISRLEEKGSGSFSTVHISTASKDVEGYQAMTDDLREKFVKRTLRRVDMRILPLLVAVYALALLDRTNLGFARLAGMDADLSLDTGNRFSIVSAIYFVPYILLELPSNLILRRAGACYWLSFITVMWGLVQLVEGFVTNWSQLAVCRFLLGAGEAGFFPAMAFIITTWYTRYEVQTRLAIFYLAALAIGGFSSILAYGLSKLSGVANLHGWQWIFIVEGALTILAGVLVFCFVVDFPDKNNFLTQMETEVILRRVEDDRGDSLPDKQNAKKVLQHLCDWKVWIFGLMFMTQTMPSYAVAFFLPIILNSMNGLYREKAYFLSAPPHVFALFFALTMAWLSDKTRIRAPYLIMQTIMSTIGLFITAYHPNKSIQYFGLFLVTAGSAACIPGILAYAANNITSQSKRAVSSAVIIAFGGLGGIFATTVFRQEDYPRYLPGFWATLICQFLNIILVAITTFYFKYKNERVRDGSAGPIEGIPRFYYTL